MSVSDPPDTTTLPSRDLAETRTAVIAETAIAPNDALRPGASVGRFLVLKRIGEGGMGSVWTAYDPDLDRKVALKLVRPDRSENDDARARMLREAQALARLSHPNVVTVHEVGVHDGNVVLAMEYVEGETLKAWLLRERPDGSPDRLARMLSIMRQAGQGLAAAHAAGMVHRDFKPANVIVGADDRVRVVDFGLARAREPPDADAPKDELVATFRSEQTRSSSGARVELHDSVTQTGAFIGTPRYMSPEQFEGQAVDPRSDIFSFATVLYEATFGESPRRGETASAIYSSMLDGPPPTPEGPDAPPWLTKTIRKGLASRPNQRFASMTEMLEALDATAPTLRRSRAGTFAIAAGIAVGAAVIAWGLRAPSREDPCAHEHERVDAIWNASTRADIEAAFAATAVPYAGKTFETVADKLDLHAAAWTTTAEESCRAGSNHDRCLASRLTELSDLVALYEHADATAVERAVDAASALAPAGWCTDARGLDEVDDARTVELRGELARAQTLTRLGNLDEARRVARAVEESAYAQAMPRVRAQAMLQLGVLPGARGRELLEDAFWLALGSAEDETAVRAAIALLRRSKDIETASVWRRHAGVLLSKHGEDVDLQASLAVALGAAATNRGEDNLAIEYHEAALRALEPARGPLDIDVMNAQYALATALMLSSRPSESSLVFRRALATIEARLGDDHPLAASIHARLAENHLALSEYPSALNEVRRALSIYERLGEGNSLRMLDTRSVLGRVLLFSGDVEGGSRELESALAALPESATGRVPAQLLLDLGTAQLLAGEPRGAMETLELALIAEERARGVRNPYVTLVLNRMTMASEQLGQFEAASALTREVIDILVATGDDVGVALQYANLGILEMKRHRHLDAIAACRRSIASYERAVGQDPRLTLPLRVLALNLIELGREREAAKELERALRLHDMGTSGSAERPKTMFALARALWADRGNRPRALALANDARTAILAAEQPDTGELEEIDDWLARHSI